MSDQPGIETLRPRGATPWKRRLAPLFLGLLPVLLLLDFGAASIDAVLAAREYLVVALALVVLAYLVTLPHGRRAAVRMACAFALVALLADSFVLGTRKEFFRRADRLAQGMTASEVARVMDQAPLEGHGHFLCDESFAFEGLLLGDIGGCGVAYDESGRVDGTLTWSDLPVIEALGPGAVVIVE